MKKKCKDCAEQDECSWCDWLEKHQKKYSEIDYELEQQINELLDKIEKDTQRLEKALGITTKKE